MTAKAKKGKDLAKGVGEPENKIDTAVPVDLALAKLNIQAARIKATTLLPYFSTALFAMHVVITEAVRTAASDSKWRAYFNPRLATTLSIDELAGVFLHEVGHCLREHSNRFEGMGQNPAWARVYNIAGDVLINHDLVDDKVTLPEWVVYLKTLKEKYQVEATREMSTEEIYLLIKQKVEESCTCGKTGIEKEQQSSNSQDKQDGQGQGDSQDEGEGNQEGQGKGESEQEGEGQGEGKSDQQGQGSGQGTSEADCPVHGGHNHSADGSGEPCEKCQWIPDCGSVADGQRRDYEEEGEASNEGVNASRGDLLRRHTAEEIRKEIQNPSKNRGSVPAGWKRWADEILDPVVDWRKELSSIVRKSFAQVAGKRDYTYRRPSRRQASMRDSGSNIILPAMRAPEPPRVAIVIDTSGSMSDEYLGWALAETNGVLRSIGSNARNVKLISCDASASSQRVNNINQIKLSGGGGTDMRVGIEAALEGRDKAQVVIVLTDGYTPWPDEPLTGGVTLIVGLTDENSKDTVPDWARTVLITREQEGKSRV